MRQGRFRPARFKRGLYRLRDFPIGPNEELWAAMVSAGPEAVISHESALRVHDLSDVVPHAVHLWIPYAKRPRHQPKGFAYRIKFHIARVWLRPDEITMVDGLRVTTPLRTLVDVAEGGTSPEQVVAGIRQALERRWIKAEELQRAARSRGPKLAARAAQYLREATE